MMTKEIVVERYGQLAVHDGQRRFCGVDAAAPPRRELPGPARRADARARSSPTTWARCSDRSTAAPLPLLLADEPAHSSGTRGLAAERAVPDAASRQPVFGSNPTNPDNLCGQKILLFGADRTELLPASGVACGLPAALIWSPDQSDRGALRDVRLPALRLRRPDHARRTEREGPERDRQRRRPVRAERVTGGTDHGRAVRRPEREGGRHRHRRELHAGAQGGRPGRAGDPLRARAA